MNRYRIFVWLFVFFLVPGLAYGEELSGIVRNVNYGSHSFGLDVPPLTRIYINEGTGFQTPGGNKFRSLQVGDRVEVKGRRMQPGTFIATKVKVVGHVQEVKDLASDAINIKLNQRFLMGVNQTAVLIDGGKSKLKLHSKEFINTLCKGGYDCAGEGEVGMRFDISGSGDKGEVLLTSKNHRKPTSPVKVEFSGYEIQLVESGEDVVLLVVRPAS